jgi:alpha-beta hydrolase superfamily lysophospholipase
MAVHAGGASWTMHEHLRLDPVPESEIIVNPSQGSVVPTRIEARIGRAPVLPGRLWAASHPTALIALVHGIGEHSGRYNALAGELASSRYTVVGVDLPGNGSSPGPRGDFSSWTTVRDQVVQAMWTATLTQPGDIGRLPRILFGHSMGGLIALDYALSHPRDLHAVVASAPALKTAMPPWWKLALANVAAVTAPSVGFPTGLDESGMSRDAEVVRGRAEDPLVHQKISPRLYNAMNEARQRVLRDARRLSVPALILHGQEDRLVDPAGSAEFVAAAPRALVTSHVYPGAYHEIFNDPARTDAIRDLKAWLADVVAAARTR